MAETIAAGGLEFFVENRESREDGGPSLQVRAVVNGEKVQLLRFDMFRVQPHYHYAPRGENRQYDVDPLFVDDGIGWAIRTLQEKLPRMLERAGYPELARSSDLPAIMAALPQIEQQWRKQPVSALP